MQQYPNDSAQFAAAPNPVRTPYPNPAAGYPYARNGASYPPNVYPAQPAVGRRPTVKAPAAPRMSKAEALHITHRLKRGAVWFALAAFVSLAGLASAHAVGATAASSNTQGLSSGNNDQQPENQQNNPFGSNQPGTGTFNPGGSSQVPVTGSGVS